MVQCMVFIIYAVYGKVYGIYGSVYGVYGSVYGVYGSLYGIYGISCRHDCFLNQWKLSGKP